MEHAARTLHRCEECASSLVQPREWHEAEPLDAPAPTKSFWVERWCPDCGWTSEDLFDQCVLEGYEEELDRGTDMLVTVLRDLERQNMSAEIDRFVGALEAGAVLPADF